MMAHLSFGVSSAMVENAEVWGPSIDYFYYMIIKLSHRLQMSARVQELGQISQGPREESYSDSATMQKNNIE